MAKLIQFQSVLSPTSTVEKFSFRHGKILSRGQSSWLTSFTHNLQEQQLGHRSVHIHTPLQITSPLKETSSYCWANYTGNNPVLPHTLAHFLLPNRVWIGGHRSVHMHTSLQITSPLKETSSYCWANYTGNNPVLPHTLAHFLLPNRVWIGG